MTVNEILEQIAVPVYTGNRTLVVHLHEDHKLDRAGLSILEKMVAQDQPITLAFGQENVQNWLGESRSESIYDRVKRLAERQSVDIALRRSRTLKGKTPQQEYGFVRTYFKKAGAYCPDDGRITDETIQTAKELGISRVIIPRIFSVSPYRRKNEQVEIVTVTPLHRVGFGPHRFIHLDQIPAYEEEVKEHIERGLKPLSLVEREVWLPAKVINRIVAAVNNGMYAAFRLIQN